MPFFDDLYTITLQHSGQQIDNAVEAALTASSSQIIPSYETYNDGDLVSVSAVAKTMASEIIEAYISFFSVSGDFTRTYTQGSLIGLPAVISADHYLLRAELSDPTAMTSDWTVTTGEGTVQISGSSNGNSTSIRLLLGRALEATLSQST